MCQVFGLGGVSCVGLVYTDVWYAGGCVIPYERSALTSIDVA